LSHWVLDIVFNDLIAAESKVTLEVMKILGITAHPDDEAGAFGGTLLLYHTRGVKTYVVCLTPGQAASNRGMAQSDEELADMRRKEFADSCRILQISGAEVLNYPDGGLQHVDLFSAVGELTRRIRDIKPEIILTMGPEGAITGHPDHSMASIFATMAFHWAARADRYPEQLTGDRKPHQARKLYYATAPLILPDRPPVSPPPCTATIDIGHFLEDKLNAFRAHSTQAPLMARVEKTMRKFGSRELFHLAACNHASTAKHETDLLEDLTE
jgi:LmbE family N-acetylglucosaminyl deacetylase